MLLVILFWDSILLAWCSPGNLGQHISYWFRQGRGGASAGPSGAVGGHPRLGPAVSSPARQQGRGERGRSRCRLGAPLQSSWSPRWKEVIPPPPRRALLSMLCPLSKGSRSLLGAPPAVVLGLLGDPRPPPVTPTTGSGRALDFPLYRQGNGSTRDQPLGRGRAVRAGWGTGPWGCRGLHGGPSRAEARRAPSGGVRSGGAFVLLQESGVRTGQLGTAAERPWPPPGVPLLLTARTASPFPLNKPPLAVERILVWVGGK